MSQWTGYPPLPIFRRQMVSYICAWIPMTSTRPSTEIITRCPLWRKLLTSSCTLTSSPSWLPAMNTGQSSLTRTPVCLRHSTVPFGRYCFLWLPFGFICSQDIFQKKMDQILEECQGCIGITDDITVHSCTEAEHDECLQNLMQIACKYDLVFNPQKTHVKAPAVNFFGCLYNADGVSPRPGERLTLHMPYWHQQTSLNSKSS